MTIREYAAKVGHTIVGKLTLKPEWSYTTDSFGNKIRKDGKWYIDEAGNEYHVSKKGCCIIDSEGGCI